MSALILFLKLEEFSSAWRGCIMVATIVSGGLKAAVWGLAFLGLAGLVLAGLIASPVRRPP